MIDPGATAALRRTALLQRLEDIFLAEGFSAFTTDDLCRRLHCSKTTLYGIAGTREQIIQAVIRHFFARSTATIEAMIATDDDPARRIVRYLGGIGAAMRRNSALFYADLVGYPPTAEIYRVNSAAAARRVRSFIDDGVAAGVFRPNDAALAARSVTLLIDGVQSGALLEGTDLSPGQAYAELGELVVFGLVAPSTGHELR
ncbi:MAG: TetR family transcriptional regulator C-terminal domain-containing protein [Cryobacterium sp.]